MKDSNNILPIKTYNASKDKSLIYTENKNKSGIYRWNNLIRGKSYVGSSKCLDLVFITLKKQCLISWALE